MICYSYLALLMHCEHRAWCAYNNFPQFEKAMAANPTERPALPPGDGNSPPEEAVREELAGILASPELRGRPMLREFFRFIVEKTLAGCAHEIKGYTVATQVFGRRADFDPVKDPIVRIQAGRLRRALERYYQVAGRQDQVRIVIPLGTYVPAFHQLDGKPGGEGRSLTEMKDPVLAIPLGPSIAVMPLLNLTGDPSQEYFAAGLAEELTNELARFQDLRVIACQSTLRWKGQQFDAREVGRDLGVRFLLEGSVRRDSGTIKIAAQLVDTASGVQLWGEQYRREPQADSLIALQEEIARIVAARVGSEYGIIPRTLSRESRKKPPESLETYEALLHFYHYVTLLTPEAFSRALRVLDHAVARDPECGLAWSLLGLLYCHNITLQFSPVETPLEKAMTFARKGAALEPRNQLVRSTLANLHFLRNERRLCLQEADKALALNPHAPALVGFLGWLQALYGEWERGLAILAKGVELNPYYPGWFHMAPCLDFYRRGRYLEAYQEAQQLDMPQLFWDPLLRAATLGELGRTREAGAALAELLRLRPDFPTTGTWLIRCYVKFEYLSDAILDGLQKAGLQI
jgi:adenylate cyclase